MSLSLFISKQKMLRVSIRVLLSLLFVLNSTEVRSQTEIGKRDFLVAVTLMGFATGVELVAKDYFLPVEPRFSTPNTIDASIRNTLYLGETRQDIAREWSDHLIYGISMSSLVWGPLLSEDHKQAALINMEVFAANSLFTNLAKISAARERPYHYYGTRPSTGPTDNASFFSGHSSVAFSQAVTNAILLGKYYPEQETLIWTSLLATAGMTAYLRVAGDMHYFSDVVVGAGAGSLIAWMITHYELKRFSNTDSKSKIEFGFSLPHSENSEMNFGLVLKFHLG